MISGSAHRTASVLLRPAVVPRLAVPNFATRLNSVFGLYQDMCGLQHPDGLVEDLVPAPVDSRLPQHMQY